MSFWHNWGAEVARRREERRLREEDRQAARAVLTQDSLPPLSQQPTDLPHGEVVYFRLPATLVVRQGDAYKDLSKGELLLTNRHLRFLSAEALPPLTIDAIMKVDAPYIDLLEVTYLRDERTREVATVLFGCDRPLVAAAYLSRLVGFRLILG
ncbi:MAG: hypothetical protein IRY95_02455 [Clostridia bacterium]|nr:hypothetical protein [Clostridia bacterium]